MLRFSTGRDTGDGLTGDRATWCGAAFSVNLRYTFVTRTLASQNKTRTTSHATTHSSLLKNVARTPRPSESQRESTDEASVLRVVQQADQAPLGTDRV